MKSGAASWSGDRWSRGTTFRIGRRPSEDGTIVAVEH
jgi:hypothetical protein